MPKQKSINIGRFVIFAIISLSTFNEEGTTRQQMRKGEGENSVATCTDLSVMVQIFSKDLSTESVRTDDRYLGHRTDLYRFSDKTDSYSK